MGVQGKLSPLANLGKKSGEMVPVSLDELRAEMKKAAREVVPVTRARTAVSFLGCWLDSAGNTVLVQWDSAASQKLTATLTQPGRADIRLSMWQTDDNGVWHCGEAILGMRTGSSEQLSWVSRDGSISTWTWTAFTMEALAAKGFLSQTDVNAHEPSAAFRELAFHSCLDDGAPQEWIPVCVTFPAPNSAPDGHFD